jgi:hypothetical protein
MFYLKRNLPHWERAARLVLALLVAAAAASFFSGMAAWAGWLGAATLALTAAVGFCPACAMIGRRSIGG